MPNKRRKVETTEPHTFRGEYTFVNKEASNIDSKEHNPAVAWHVMNRYERWKKSDAAKKLRASANIPSGLSSPQSVPQTYITRSPAQVPQVSTTTSGPSNRPKQSATPTNPSLGTEVWPFETTTRQNLGNEGLSFPTPGTGISTPTYLDLDLVQDPSRTPVELEVPAPSLSPFAPFAQYLFAPFLEFATSRLLPVRWPAELGRPNWQYEKQRTYGDFAAVNFDTAYANALLALISRLQPNESQGDFQAMQTTFFKEQADQEIQQQLQAQDGTSSLLTLMAILTLFLCESCDDDTAAARTLLKTLQKLVSASGGVILFDSWFQENLLAADSYFALKYETRPLFSADEWSPGPLSNAWKSRLTNARIPDDHAAFVHGIVDHITLRAIIIDLRELFQVQMYVNNHAVAPDDQLLRWRQMRKYDCISRLAEHQLNLKIFPHLFERPALQRTCCITTALMAAMVLGTPEPVRFGVKLLRDLKTSMSQTLIEIQADITMTEALVIEAGNFVLWATYVGMIAEKVHPSSDRDGHFEVNFNALLTDVGLSLEEAHEDIFSKFIFSRSLQAEVNAGRAYRKVETRAGLFDACGTSWREPVEQFDYVDAGKSPGSVGRGQGKDI